MRPQVFFAASTLSLLCCAALALAPNTRGTQSAQGLQSGTPVEIPLATASRFGRAKNSWWPTKNARAPEDFVGNKVCATCHAEKIASQIATPMAHAASRVSSAKVLRDHPSMTATRGNSPTPFRRLRKDLTIRFPTLAIESPPPFCGLLGLPTKGKRTYMREAASSSKVR